MESNRFGDITLIEGNNTGRYPFCHSLLIEGPKRTLVDPACGRRKMEAVRENGGVDTIINTHFHEDHVTYNHLFPEARVWAHNADRGGLASIAGYLEMSIDMAPDLRSFWAEVLAERFHFTGWTLSRALDDGDEIMVGDTRMRVVHTPGHTPGHLCLHFPDAELVYLGDIDLCRFGPWYGDRTSDIDDFIESIRKVAAIEARCYVPSHEGPVYEEIGGLAETYIGVIEERDERILEAIGEPATLDEVSGEWIIYGKPREPEAFFMASERAMVAKHLERLVRGGHARLEDGRYVAV